MTVTRTATALGLTGVRAAYEGVEALHGIDLALPYGRVLALLGPNGAGKSTTIGVCGGFVPVTDGDVRLAGRSIVGAAPDALARAGVGTVPEGGGVFPNLTVLENLQLATSAGMPVGAVEAIAYERFPQIAGRRKRLAGSLSGGEQQMLALARALARDPAVLLIDELSMGLAPVVVGELYETVAGLAAEGVSILVVEQFAHAVLGVADLAAIMVNGRVRVVGPPDDVAGELSSAYLGG